MSGVHVERKRDLVWERYFFQESMFNLCLRQYLRLERSTCPGNWHTANRWFSDDGVPRPAVPEDVSIEAVQAFAKTLQTEDGYGITGPVCVGRVTG